MAKYFFSQVGQKDVGSFRKYVVFFQTGQGRGQTQTFFFAYVVWLPSVQLITKYKLLYNSVITGLDSGLHRSAGGWNLNLNDHEKLLIESLNNKSD